MAQPDVPLGDEAVIERPEALIARAADAVA